ncbi:MAG: T9SS type A sorting domain-containing protein [Bacteroidales bacterium]|nr:T9SS type A sorting domain-containing protein [Bacteroidales bacterium]
MQIPSIRNKSVLRRLWIYCLMSFSVVSWAQIPLVPYMEVPVKADGEMLKNAWAGGLNSPQFSMIDLDGDGFKDLVAFERGDYGVFKTFRNTGNFDAVEFHYAPEYLAIFPNLQNWALLVDYNNDGHEDLFASVPAGLKVYRNDYSETHGNRFVLEENILHAEGPDGQEVVYVSPPDLPAITDVDNDGDIDILSFEILGNHVAFYRNLSMDLYGNNDHLEFELATECWGYFREDGTSNSITLFDTCDMEKTGSTKHAGSTLLAFDADNNGLVDLALGDISYNSMTLLFNNGSQLDATMTDLEYSFPSGTQPVDISVFPAAYLLDLDNDASRDLIVTPNNPNTSDNFENIWYYRNTGSDLLPEFEFQQNDYLQNEMFDVGEGAVAKFFDENGDGLQDILVGNYGYYIESAVYQSQIALLRNTGTQDQPQFELITRDYEGFSAFGMDGMYPAFGDMDNDGDVDMITGDENGNIHYFRNDGGAGNPADFTLSQPNYKGIDVGQSAKPQIVDVNRDGKPDLVVGKRDGRISYYENTGTAENPDFPQDPTNDYLGNIDVMNACCTGFSAPFLTEDSTGNYLMYVGSEMGKLFLYNNIEGNLDGAFNPVDSLYLHGMNISVSGFDINNNGKTEILLGKYEGGISLYKKGVPQVYGTKERISHNTQLLLYPNPVRDRLIVRNTITLSNAIVEIKILDPAGRIISKKDLTTGTGDFYLDTSKLQAGFYLLSIHTGKSVLSGGFIKK